jgi:hypothetical protein
MRQVQGGFTDIWTRLGMVSVLNGHNVKWCRCRVMLVLANTSVDLVTNGVGIAW